MWSFILDHAKLANCGSSRKTPDSKKAPQRKLRFEDSSPTRCPQRQQPTFLDYAKLAVCDGLARKAPEVNDTHTQKLHLDDSSPTKLLEGEQQKRRVSSQDLRDCAGEIVRSVSMDSLAESVRSLGVTFWWEQDAKVATVSQKKPMRETVLVSNELVNFLSGVAPNQNDMDDKKQTVMKTVEDACRVGLELRPQLGGDKMQGVAITGTGHERERAKSMIVRLASFCRADTLSSVMDAWDDLSSPFYMHGFMSDSAGHEFQAWTSADSSSRVEVVPEVPSLVHGDMRLLRTKLTEKRWRKEMETLNHLCICDCSICRSKNTKRNAEMAQNRMMVASELACDVDERSPARVVRELSRYSESSFDKKLQTFSNHCVQGS